MQYYRCKCGNLESWGSLPPARCRRCPDCGSNVALGPDDHTDPADHDYSAHVEQMGERGWVKIPVCRYCHRPQWEVERTED